MLATDISASNCLYYWVYSVSSTGIFVKNKNAAWTTTGYSGVPSGWIIISSLNTDITLNPNIYLEFDVQESGYFGLNKVASHQTIYVSKDKINWMTINSATVFETLQGEKYYVCGTITDGDFSISNYTQFKITGKVSCTGNINSLLDYNGINVGLKPYCYRSMFEGCTGLTTAPELPATTLASYCY
jgi:hypothetical protein